MKSLALHLIAFLPLLGSLHTITHRTVTLLLLTVVIAVTATAASASAATAVTSDATVKFIGSTTTWQPPAPSPSLHAPHHWRPTTEMTTPRTTTTTTTTAATSKQRQHNQPSPSLAARRIPAHANSDSTSRNNNSNNRKSRSHSHHIFPVESNATPTSSRLVRDAITTSNDGDGGGVGVGGARQNRSFQSGATVVQLNGNNDNNNNNNNHHHQTTAGAGTSTGDVDTRKYKHLDRRQQFRVNQRGSEAATTTPTSPSPAPSRSPSSHAAVETVTASAAAATAAAAADVVPSSSLNSERQSMSTFMANHRQNKQLNAGTTRGGDSGGSVGVGDGDGAEPMERAVQMTRNSTKPKQQTPKTSRMIQRLVAGHIQNAEGRSTYQVSAVSTNSTVTNSSTTLRPSSLYFRRKQPMLSSSYRNVKTPSTTTPKSSVATATTSTTSKPLKLQSLYVQDDRDLHGTDDDEALLEDPGDFDNWDNGILRSSAGSGKEMPPKLRKANEDKSKTLSDQVREGKYGLIEKELFRRPPKRPGVLSYLPNKEVPIDNEKNFGGLDEEDIWLAEDHLLVIKGGSLNKGELEEPWPPIDDYDAPGRQIKIPTDPKVPPPFPVQLEENGPVQFIGNNKFTVVYPVANESIPVYPAGPEGNYPPSEGDSDDEKNLLTRPGTPQNVAEGEPGYVYPAPYPPWLYHNQTFVNPFLTNARPITFPGLGPFPFRENGTIDHLNGTDYFDEDDPSLYYPPAYSFVYKSNYTNPVPPGPLVPGIVLPPPANQFSRLEKPDKISKTFASPPPSPPSSPTVPRHRTYTTPSTTTTTTVTSTSSTTETPFRHAITQISHYTPKTIIITPSPPEQTSSLPPTRIPTPTPSTTKLPPTPAQSPRTSTQSPPAHHPSIIEAVPVPVAVPIPIYPSNKYPQRPNIVTFVPTTPQPSPETLSKANPIYYEYFEAKRQPTTSNVIDDFLSTTAKPPGQGYPSKPIKLYSTSKRPYKAEGQRNYLQPVPPQQPFVPENIVYITPKPEVRYKRPPQQAAPQAPIFKPRPLENFEREVSAIRETLRYYQNQQLRDNSIPRTPKAKPIYEYTFDATKNLEPIQSTVAPSSFHPPTEFDEEPFKPMVTYSPPVDDENAFRAIAVDKVDPPLTQAQQQQQQRPKYQSTTTLIPVQPNNGPYRAPQGRTKKLRLGAKYLPQPQVPEYREEPQYQATPRTILTTQTPWVTVNKQELNDYIPQQQQPQLQPQPHRHYSERLRMPTPLGSAKHHRGFPGYYYTTPLAHVRQNNRFYDEPFQQPIRKIINYHQPPQQPPYQQQQQQPPQRPPQPIWSLENDTYVNYAPNRPPLNPDAEFINPYQTVQVNPVNSVNHYADQGQRYPQVLPPPISHQSQYYPLPQQPLPPQRLPPNYHSPPPRQYQQQQQIPLHRDILVNYRQPLPPINPDSEYIPQSAQVVGRIRAQQIYRSNPYHQQSLNNGHSNNNNNDDDDVDNLGGGVGEAGENGQGQGIYYITPKYRRSNGGNNNNNNNGNGNGNNSRGSTNNKVNTAGNGK